ncbi:hypothetical protein A4X09_0g5022 [Tilletia walkeri]|uniref:Uncharacterized protein n=1 Tax=Tilletia walkeri TaxID=117179 RepID=A0A8X7T4G3_9BASI|nr:hypothetical protein A4X09_0g5022 [Tilletia walkeri]
MPKALQGSSVQGGAGGGSDRRSTASASSKRPRPLGKSKGGHQQQHYETVEEALDAAVGIEERAERFAQSQGDKARRLFEEALFIYHRAIEIGGENFADACYNAGRTSLVLATGFYTPSQARPALQLAITHFLSALSARLSDPNIAEPSTASNTLLAHVSEEVKLSVALFENGSDAAVMDVLNRPPAAAFQAIEGSNLSEGEDSDTIDPFVVDIISNAAGALQALAELDDHYGQLGPPISVRNAISVLPVSPVVVPLRSTSTMVAAVRMYALACMCFSHAIAFSSIGQETGSSIPDVSPLATGGIDIIDSNSGADEAMTVDDDAVMESEPGLSSTYEGSTNPLTPSGYAEALSNCYSAVSTLLSLVDTSTNSSASALPTLLVTWAVGAGRTVLFEADRLQTDVSKEGSNVDETEREGCSEELATLQHAPLLLDVAALMAAESRSATSHSRNDPSFMAELERLEKSVSQVADGLLARTQEQAAPTVEELCDIADAAVSMSQLRIRVTGIEGLGTSESRPAVLSDLPTATAAWSTASSAAKVLVKAYALLEASNSATAPASDVVLGDSTRDGRGGLLSERQRTQLGISLCLAQVSLLRLHPVFHVLRAAQSPEEARKTIDVLRANATAYSRRALQQAGLRWVLQYADDGGKSVTSGRKLGAQWATEQARSLEHDERVLHDGWEVLSLRAEALMVAIRAGWYKFVSQDDVIRQVASSYGSTPSAGNKELFQVLLQSQGSGLELSGLLECLLALTKSSSTTSSVPGQFQQGEKIRDIEEIAQSWSTEVFRSSLGGPPSTSTISAALTHIRALEDMDELDGSISAAQDSASPNVFAGSIRLDGLGTMDELSFWEWAVQGLLGERVLRPRLR